MNSEPLILGEIAAAIGATVSGPCADLRIRGISTDTRAIGAGDLFVALTGVNADGHDYAQRAADAGAAAMVISRPIENLTVGPATLLTVADTEIAYGRIAGLWRNRFDLPVVGVTGSVGKTTTKEMLAAALSPLGPILKTEASQNTETGVPKTLLNLRPEHRAAVIEMGTRGAGQIAYLCGFARPTVGVITLIGETHIELLGSRDGIADAKAELVRSLNPHGAAVLNADDPYFSVLSAAAGAPVRSFGIAAANADCRATDIEKTEYGWSFRVSGVPVRLSSPARHDIANALAALAAAQALGVPLPEAAEALGAYSPPRMRMQVHRRAGDLTILDDSYNASPTSVAGALETLRGFAAKRKMAYLGDMKELGAFGPDMHRAVADEIRSIGGLDALYTVGELAGLIPGATERFAESTTAAEFAARSMDCRPGDAILIKGSRSMAMERIVDALLKRFPAAVSASETR